MKNRSGFTLLELIIVIIILGILAAIALPRYFANIENARQTEAKSTLGRIREAQLAVYAHSGAYATDWANLTADFNNDGQADISLAQPSSSSFTYSLGAISSVANGGNVTKTWEMCYESGKFGEDASVTCP